MRTGTLRSRMGRLVMGGALVWRLSIFLVGLIQRVKRLGRFSSGEVGGDGLGHDGHDFVPSAQVLHLWRTVGISNEELDGEFSESGWSSLSVS